MITVTKVQMTNSTQTYLFFARWMVVGYGRRDSDAMLVQRQWMDGWRCGEREEGKKQKPMKRKFPVFFLQSFLCDHLLCVFLNQYDHCNEPKKRFIKLLSTAATSDQWIYECYLCDLNRSSRDWLPADGDHSITCSTSLTVVFVVKVKVIGLQKPKS